MATIDTKRPAIRRKNKSWLGVKMWASFIASILIGLAGLVCTLWVLYSPDSKDANEPKTRDEKIADQFSVFDGRHYKLCRSVRQLMNDPGSFVHVKTRYADNGDDISVSMTYRGKNKLGGVVTETAIGRFSIDGELLEISTQQ